MAGTVTTTEERFGSIKRIKFDWLSDASGDATATTTYTYSGEVLRAIFVPDGSTTAPSDLYDVTITDADSIDILYGQGADMDGTNTVVLVENLAPVANDVLSLTVANGGNAKGGIVYLYIR